MAARGDENQRRSLLFGELAQRSLHLGELLAANRYGKRLSLLRGGSLIQHAVCYISAV